MTSSSRILPAGAMRAEVYAVPVLDRWLVHAPLHHLTALVNRAAVDAMAAGASPLDREFAGPAEAAPAARSGPFNPPFLGLIPTRACNMNCVYCGFGSTFEAEAMDPGLACAGVDWMAAHSVRTGRSTLDVHFFGGEPMQAPEVVDVAVHRTRARAAERGLRPRLEISTNGCYGEARSTFAGDYFHTVSLSFDGFAPVHDRHRPLSPGRGSFESVSRTARVLSRSSTRLCLRICVADDNVEALPEIVDWFCTEFCPEVIDFETLQPTPESARAELRPPDPYRFAERLLRASQVAANRGVEPVYAAAQSSPPRATFCPLGNDALILQPDGRASSCYLLERDWRARGLDLHIGRLDPDGTLHLEEAAVSACRRLVLDKPICHTCFCRWSCAGGCHVNHSFPGHPGGYDDFCIQTRLITASALLSGMGQAPLAESLVSDRLAMERLAGWPDDRIGDGMSSDT